MFIAIKLIGYKLNLHVAYLYLRDSSMHEIIKKQVNPIQNNKFTKAKMENE